jgi:hypothetical protein
MHGTIIRAELGFTTMSCVSWIANASSIHAASVAIAGIWALWLFAAIAHPSLSTLALAIGLAHTMAGALVGAPLDVTLRSNIFACLTDALAIFTVTVHTIHSDLTCLIGSCEGSSRANGFHRSHRSSRKSCSCSLNMRDNSCCLFDRLLWSFSFGLHITGVGTFKECPAILSTKSRVADTFASIAIATARAILRASLLHI